MKPVKEPVDLVLEGILDYFEVITRLMGLSTIKADMDSNEYTSAKQFEADIRLMFQNCYTYWTETDAMFAFCKDFEKAWTGRGRKERDYLVELGGREKPEWG